MLPADQVFKKNNTENVDYKKELEEINQQLEAFDNEKTQIDEQIKAANSRLNYLNTSYNKIQSRYADAANKEAKNKSLGYNAAEHSAQNAEYMNMRRSDLAAKGQVDTMSRMGSGESIGYLKGQLDEVEGEIAEKKTQIQALKDNRTNLEKNGPQQGQLKAKQAELEAKIKAAEVEKLKAAEAEKQKVIDAEKQKAADAEKLKAAEAEKQKAAEAAAKTQKASVAPQTMPISLTTDSTKAVSPPDPFPETAKVFFAALKAEGAKGNFTVEQKDNAYQVKKDGKDYLTVSEKGVEGRLSENSSDAELKDFATNMIAAVKASGRTPPGPLTLQGADDHPKIRKAMEEAANAQGFKITPLASKTVNVKSENVESVAQKSEPVLPVTPGR